MVLAGYTRPFTPLGDAASVPALPWQFAGDLLLFHFRADAGALTALLPEPLEPGPRPDEAFLWSPRLCCHPVGTHPGKLHPARTFYNVAVVGIPCRAWGERRMFSAFQWSDRDWLVILSWFLGSCSKLAVVEETGLHPLLAGTGSGGEAAIARTVSRHGEQIIRMEFAPEREVELDDLSFYLENLPLICMRHIPDCQVPPLGHPLLHDLTEMVMTDTRFGQAVQGRAALRFCAADNEELLPLQPKEVLGGYRLPLGFALQGVRTVYDYLKEGRS